MDNLLQFFHIIGALAFFVYGMKMLSEGVQRAAGSQMRKALRSLTNNKYVGLIVGFILTALIQSSSATTVLVVGLVNAGIINLAQSVGLIMGANIGTTLTSWIIAWSEFQVHLTHIALILLAVGVPMSIRSKISYKYWGEFLVGLGIMLMSLDLLSSIVPTITDDNPIFSQISRMSNSGFSSKILFIFIGAILTMVVQSSSAALALIVILCTKGYIPFGLAMCLVLGMNIGTTMTAEIAALVGNRDARRAARIHSLFNIIGVVLVVIFLPWINTAVVYIVEQVFHLHDPNSHIDSISNGLAVFHTLFNILTTIILLPFSNYLIQGSHITISKSASDRSMPKSLVIKTNLKTPEFSIIEIKRDLAKYSEITNRMQGFNNQLFLSFNQKEQNNLFERLEKYRGISIKINAEIKDYITDTFNNEITNRTNQKLRGIYHINDEIKKISHSFYAIAEQMMSMRTEKLWLTPGQRNEIMRYGDLTHQLCKKMYEILDDTIDNASSVFTTQSILDKIETLKEGLNDFDPNNEDDENINVKGSIVYDNIIAEYNTITELAKKVLRLAPEL